MKKFMRLFSVAYSFFLWRNSSTRALAATLLKFLGYIQLFAEAAAYATHNKHKRRISIPSAGFESAIPAVRRLLIYTLLQLLVVYRKLCCPLGLVCYDV